MEKKMKTLSVRENCFPQASENTTPLDSTNDPDIIECSILNENNFDFIKRGKFIFNKSSCTSALENPLQTEELKDSCNSPKRSIDVLRSSLRYTYRLINDSKTREETQLSLKTPCCNVKCKKPNSAAKKFISTLKKTPDGPYLSKSKLRNIEHWLNENEVETVCTPPFANLSITPVNSLKKKFSFHLEDENKSLEESSLDSEVEGVLKAVYGDNWKQKNNWGHARTEPKKKTIFSPATLLERELGECCSAKRNILNDKELNLVEKRNKENIFENSFLSGVKIINLDSSSYSSGEDTKMIDKSITKKKKKKKIANRSLESFCYSPVNKKPNIVPHLSDASMTQTLNISSSKKFVSKVELKTPKKTFLASLSVSTPTSKCHPDAQYYKINFKSKKEELVKKLFKLYNFEVFDGKLPEDMNFSWNIKLRGTAGYCYNKRITKSTGEVIRISRIEFSSKVVDRADRLRDTMIHELCHAASWVIDSVLDGHGNMWNKWASRAMSRFPELPAIKRCHNYEILSKYVYRCTGCGYSIKRHSKSINTERKRCGYCYGALELFINKRRKGKGEVPEFDTTKTLPTPNKFAVFVKENYHSVKSSKINAKHSEIMKILSQQYALFKNGSKSFKKLQNV